MLQDDVPEAVKSARLQEIIATYRAGLPASMGAEVGRRHLVRFFKSLRSHLLMRLAHLPMTFAHDLRLAQKLYFESSAKVSEAESVVFCPSLYVEPF